ncbi:MAG: hypothetical protein ACRCTT_21110 [Enterobacter roggenkampii]
MSILNIIKNFKKEMEQGYEELSIFVFEGGWLTLKEFSILEKCASKRILIITEKKAMEFLSAMLLSNNISYVLINIGMNELTETIKYFIRDLPSTTNNQPPSSSQVFSYLERRILSLYIKEVPSTNIASRVGKSAKQIYSIKKSTMSKMGLVSDAELVSYWDIISYRLYSSLPVQAVSPYPV